MKKIFLKIKKKRQSISLKARYLFLGVLVGLLITAGAYYVQAVTGEAPNLDPAESWDTVKQGVDNGDHLTDGLWNGLVNRMVSHIGGITIETSGCYWTNNGGGDDEASCPNTNEVAAGYRDDSNDDVYCCTVKFK